MRRRRVRSVVLAALIAMVVGAGCKVGDDVAYSVGVLDIVPNPAQQGDVVSFNFNLVVVPERNFTLTAFIDDTEHASQARQEQYAGPFEFVIGDAADLIAEYGVGTHSARVVLRIQEDNRVFETSTTDFELQ